MAVKIAPSILSADFGHLNEDIATVDHACDWIHVDVMDGHFVPNLSFGAPVIKDIKSKLPLDVHLMIDHPEKYLEDFVKAGADYLTVHAETVDDLRGILVRIRELGASSGVSVKPGTGINAIKDVLDVCDMVLIMTVEPGFGGQSFMHECVSKITELRDMGYEGEISVDGGIKADTGKIVKDAGASVLVAGSYIFGAEDREVAIESLR